MPAVLGLEDSRDSHKTKDLAEIIIDGIHFLRAERSWRSQVAETNGKMGAQ